MDEKRGWQDRWRCAREHLERCEEASEEATRAYREFWHKLAGSRVPAMLESRDAAVAALDDADPNVRRVAIGILKEVWRISGDEVLGAILERMVFHDPERVLRAVAVGALATCYRATDNIRVGLLLARMVCDENTPDVIRRYAYQGLYTVRGRVMPLWPGLSSSPRRPLQIPEDVDWPFVHSFLDPTRASVPEDILGNSLKNHSSSVRQMVLLGHAVRNALNEGDYERAIADLSTIIQQAPFLAGAFCERGEAYLALGQCDAAVADFSQAIRVAPDPERAYSGRAEAYKRLGRDSLAQEDLRRKREIRSWTHDRKE